MLSVFLRQREGSVAAPSWPHGFQSYPKELKNDSIKNVCADEPADLGNWMLIDSTSFGRLNSFSKGETPFMGFLSCIRKLVMLSVELSFLNFNEICVNLFPV